MCFKHLGFFVVFLQLFWVWLTFLLYSMPFILIHNLPRILMNFTEGNTSIQKQRAENGSWLPRKYLNRWSYFSFYVECRNNDEIKIVMQNSCECVGLFIVATPVKPMQRRDWRTPRLFRFQFWIRNSKMCFLWCATLSYYQNVWTGDTDPWYDKCLGCTYALCINTK